MLGIVKNWSFHLFLLVASFQAASAESKYEWKNFSEMFPNSVDVANSKWTGQVESKKLFGHLLNSCVDKQDLVLFCRKNSDVVEVKNWRIKLPFKWRQPADINPDALGSAPYIYIIAKLTPSIFPRGCCDGIDLRRYEQKKELRVKRKGGIP